MFDKIKGLFKGRKKDSDEVGRRSGTAPGARKQAKSAAARPDKSVAKDKKTTAKKAGVKAIDLSQASSHKTLEHTRELRLSLARSRTSLSSGDMSAIKQARAARLQLARAQTRATSLRAGSGAGASSTATGRGSGKSAAAGN